MSLNELIESASAPIDAIGRYLDSSSGDARWREVGALSRDAQRRLYEKAGHGMAIELSHFVADAAPLTEVIHEGLNTLPLPGGLRRFQKRFCRPAGGEERLFGYNEGPTRRLIGPGFFVVVPTRGDTVWEARGAVVVDYFRVPDAAVVPGWPAVVPNERGLQRFVYCETRDFMRRVSRHVSIGAAYKRERPLDHYFVLCRG